MSFDDTEDKKKKIVDVIKVERSGAKVVIPEGASFDSIIAALQAQKTYEESIVRVTGTIDCFINEGASAFYNVLKEKFGFVNMVKTPGMFGDNPPALLTIPVGLDETIQVPWGRFNLPGLTGYVQTGYDVVNDRAVFQIQAEVTRRYESVIQELIDLTKQFVRENPVYGKKAFRIRLRDDEGDVMINPQPTFIPINPNILDELIFSDEVYASIKNSIFTPIQFTDMVRKAQGSLKRGILLSGRYGTGKSMTSAATAYLAVQNGWTFIICERAEELADVLRLAADYGPSVVFCEDIDQVMYGDRNTNMNEILNIVDGVDTKNVELMVVLTTNHVERISQAMLRPGRLDAVINVTPPDIAATERLIVQYGRGLIDNDANVHEIAERMAGNIPAVIREMVERAKLAAISTSGNFETLHITYENLIEAAFSMQNQLDLLADRVDDKRSDVEKAAAQFAAPLSAIAQALQSDNVIQ